MRSAIASEPMGKVTITIKVTNRIDEILAARGFIDIDRVRSITLENVLVDTGATRLCLPEEIISQLGLPLQGEADVKLAVGVQKVRIFREVSLTVAGREGTFNCVELPANEEPLLGLSPLEDLGLEPDLQNQRLRVLPLEGKDTYLTVM
jgi:predicted aspartyl protease